MSWPSSPRPLPSRELPYGFRERQRGESKLDALVAWEYMMLIVDRLIGHIVPVRFALFALVGGIGLLIHMLTLWFALTVAGVAFDPAQTCAAGVAMMSNFLIISSLIGTGACAFCVIAGTFYFLRNLRPGHGRQFGHSRIYRFKEPGLVACRRCRQIGLELCRLIRFHWKQK